MPIRRLLVFALLLASSSASAAVDPSLFQDLHWRLIGPFRGGRVLAVTGVPDEPQHFYFGSVNGGIWESGDAGRTWKPIFDSQPVGSIGAITIAPSDRRIIYAGSGEADMRSDIAQGDGVYKSRDAGATWTHIGLADSQQIGRIIVHPTNPSIVFVAALGHPYGPNAERGVFRSRDGGEIWQKVLGRNDDTGAIDLAFEPGNPQVIYATLWQTRRTPWSIYPPSNGPGSGMFKSSDGGDTWTEVTGHGLPANPGRIGLAVAPSQPKRVYAIIDAAEGGLYRSDDAGTTWTRASSDSRIWGRGWYFGGITVEPDNAEVVYSCNVNLYRSADGGKTFAPVRGAPGGDDYHSLWIDPQNPKRRILGIDQGAVVSTNGGQTWSSWYNQPTGQFYHAVTDNRFPYWIYGAQQDSGAAAVPSRTSSIDGINMMSFRELTAGGESDNIAPDPKDPEVIYGSRVEKLDLRTQQTQSVDPTLAYPENYRRTWTLPLVFSPRDPRVLYFANQHLFRTEDGGSHWQRISPDLTREDPGTPPNLDATTAALNSGTGPRRGVIYSIAPSRTADHDLWAGTDDGSIWRTRDDGAHWQNVTPAGLSGWSKVGVIDASHFEAETAYAAVDRHRLDDVHPYIYRTHDGGRSWQLIVTGIPANQPVNVVREDSIRRGMLFAGTERGIYVSWDEGDHWQTLKQNLPVTSVRDIDVHENDLVLGTHGRGFWVMDDITSLRQSDGVELALHHLFAPSVAVHARPAGFTGTPMPKEEPMAENPLFGAAIDYVVSHAAARRGAESGGERAHSVELEILDAAGHLVRRYQDTDPPPDADPAKLGVAPEWVEQPSRLAGTPGMHRFVWPLRYEQPRARAAKSATNGIWAPPGSYTVKLTIDGQRMSQSLTVAPDPRLSLPPAAYADQFALAQQIEQKRVAVRAALDDAGSVLKALEERTARADTANGKTAAGGTLGNALADAANRAEKISGIVPGSGTAWWLAPKTPTSLRFHDGALDALLAAVDGADAAPTADARAGWEKLRLTADAALAAWTEFRSRNLAALNAKLTAAGREAVKMP